MKMSMKIAISLLISVALFAVFFIVASSGVFRLVEAALYIPAAQKEFAKGLDWAADAIDKHHKRNVEKFKVELSKDYIPSAFLQNQSQARADIVLRDESFYKLRQLEPDLLFVRFISEDGKYIVYSTLDSDLISSRPDRKVYRTYDQAEKAIGAVLLSTRFEPKVVLDGEGNRFIYSIPVIDKYDIFKGTALFYVTLANLGKFISTLPEISVLNSVSAIGSLGIVIGIPLEKIEDVKDEIKSSWERNRAKETFSEPIGVSTKSEGETIDYLLFSKRTEAYGFIGIMSPKSTFEISQTQKIIIYVLFFVTVYLVVFIIFNLTQDPVSILSERIKLLQISFIKQFIESKEEIDWSKWHSELAIKRPEIAKTIRKGLGKAGKKKLSEIDFLINKGWDEILSVVAKRAENETKDAGLDIARIEEIITKALTRGNIVIPVKQVSDTEVKIKEKTTSPISTLKEEKSRIDEKLEEIEEAEAVEEEIEEAEAVEEVEAVEANKEEEAVEAAEEVEVIEQIEAAEEGYEAVEPVEPGQEKKEEADEIPMLQEIGLLESESIEEPELIKEEISPEAGTVSPSSEQDKAIIFEEDIESLSELEEGDEVSEAIAEMEGGARRVAESLAKTGESVGTSKPGISQRSFKLFENVDIETIETMAELDESGEPEPEEALSESSRIEKPLEEKETEGALLEKQSSETETGRRIPISDEARGNLKKLLDRMDTEITKKEKRSSGREKAETVDKKTEESEILESTIPLSLDVLPELEIAENPDEYLSHKRGGKYFLLPKKHYVGFALQGIDIMDAGLDETYASSLQKDADKLLNELLEQFASKESGLDTQEDRRASKQEIEGLLKSRKMLVYSVPDMLISYHSMRKSIVVEGGVYRIKKELLAKHGEGENPELVQLIQSVSKAGEQLSESDEMVRSEAVFMAMQDAPKITLRTKGIEFDSFVRKISSKTDDITIVRSLVALSKRLDAIFAGLIAERKGGYWMEFSVGLQDSTRSIFFFKEGDPYIEHFFKQKRAFIINVPVAEIKSLNRFFCDYDRRFLSGTAFLPAVFRGADVYIFIGFQKPEKRDMNSLIAALAI